MFSPDAAIQASVSARNPRRRQRTGSEDSVALRHNPKRIRRSVLSSEIFQPPDTIKQNGRVEQVVEEPVTNGHVREPGNQRHASGDSGSLAIRHRGIKKADRGKRTSKDDSNVELTRNENYIVTLLPTTPDSLCNYHSSGTWHGQLSSQLGYALALTQSQAIVWRYGEKPSSSEIMKPITISLLHPSNNPRHPLPLGMLVPTSTEPALLIVMPLSGKITYWESLSYAASVDANRQKQQSIQGLVSGLMSGESITRITEAEPRGFVLTMSTGRLAHLVISDTQGRPSIKVDFLRDNSASGGGVFGSLRSVFSTAGWRRDIAAVRAGNSYQRGQRCIVIATTKGTFQIWDLNWNGTHFLVFDTDAKDTLLRALKEAAKEEVVKGSHDHEEWELQILDFTLLQGTKSGKAVAKAKESGDCKLMALTVLDSMQSSIYALVGLTIANGSVIVDVVHPITCYKSKLPSEIEYRPHILVPEASQTAFIIFEKALVLVSLAEIDETPSSQLQMEAHTLPDPFQDAIGFRKTRPYRVVGCASESYDQSHDQCSCVVMVYGFGVVRIAALPLKEGQSALQRATVTAKTKIEQAVFFGSLQHDLLDFTPRPEVDFSSKEIEAAALDVSHSIMSSTSAYIPSIAPSMDLQLQRRSAALADLNKFLRKHYQDRMSRLTKWDLLWNAEKMASANAIWRCYDSAIACQQRGSDGRILLVELVEAMSQDVKVENQPEHYETDGVRHWFIHDVWRLEYVIPWAYKIAELLFQEAVEDDCKLNLATQAKFASEANDIQLAGLETAFQFREANAAAYGLEDEIMIDGVLLQGFDDLPEFWTSPKITVDNVKQLTDLSREITKLGDSAEDTEDSPSQDLVFKLALENPRQVQICCQTYIERFRWLKSRTSSIDQAEGEALTDAHFAVRKKLFASLAEIGQPDKGIYLAEKYHDMDALVAVIDFEIHSAETVKDAEMWQERSLSYFTKYGTAWADAYFNKHVIGRNAVSVLTNNANFKKHLTTYLRSHPSFAKLSWINEVLSENDYLASSHSLKMAEKQDANLWSKEIGLSMSKLSLMAATSKGQVQYASAKPTMQELDERMTVLAIQEKLYKYVKATVLDAIDAEAETDMAMQNHGTKIMEEKPVLAENLKQSLHKVLAREALSFDGMIEILTLIDGENFHTDETEEMDTRFFSALKILRLSNLEASDPGHKILLEKFIWRRCMIRDDWETINRTELKPETQVELETDGTSLFKTLREGYRTGFWNKHAPPSPSSLTEAGTTLESLRSSSYHCNMPDHALQFLAKDLEKEADLLEECIEKGRLEERWEGVVDAAKFAVRREADQAGAEKLRKREAEKEFEQRLARVNEEELKKIRGERRDEQGDVVMAM